LKSARRNFRVQHTNPSGARASNWSPISFAPATLTINGTTYGSSFVGIYGIMLNTEIDPLNPLLLENLIRTTPPQNATPPLRIWFPVAGDYSPSIIVIFSNNATPETYTYSEYRVHVLSTSELQSQELSQLEGFVGLVLLAFTFVEVVRLVRDYVKGKNVDETKRPDYDLL